MGEDALRFRLRAAECRRLASDAIDEASRIALSDMAIELDAEADRLDTEEHPPMRLPPTS